MKALIKKHSSSIAVGIISSMIFLYLLEPILKYIANTVIDISNWIGTSYVDRMFSQIAQLEIIHSTLVIYIFVNVVSAGAMYNAPKNQDNFSKDLIS